MSHISYSIRLITKRRLLLSDSYCCPSFSMPRGLPALHCIRRNDSFPTFRKRITVNNLGKSSTPTALQFRTDSYKICNLAAWVNTGKPSFDLLVSVGLYPMTTLNDFRLILPYCSTLALNPVRLGDGFLFHSFYPFRYIVGWASHPFISAKVACHPRVLTGTCQV